MQIKFEKYLIPAILFFSLYVVHWYFSKYSSYSWGDLKSISDWGAFGDFFGGVLNPLIAFGALCLLHMAYISQKQELKETRDHFENESKRNEIYKVIEQIDKEIDALLGYQVKSLRAKDVSGAEKTLGTLKELIIQDWSIRKDHYIFIQNTETKGNIDDFLKQVAYYISELVLMLNAFTKVGGSGGYLRSYYLVKYSQLIKYLEKKKYIDKKNISFHV